MSKKKIPELLIFLTGPSRGYVIKGLEEARVPYRHVVFRDYRDISSAYDCLDLYVVTSRQEGGPKAVLECMATGVPLVTTRVGQAMDLVKHGKNAWITEVEDVDGLVHWVNIALGQSDLEREKMKRTARQTAENNSYTAQIPLSKEFMEGFVEF